MPMQPVEQHPPFEDRRAQLMRSAMLNAGVGLLLLIAAAFAMGRELGLSTWAGYKSVGLYALSLAWLYRHLPSHLPRPKLFPASQVTLLRLGLTALLAGLVHEGAVGAHWLPAMITLLILALDGVDGWLARRGGWASEFGARFDMETDAILVLVLSALVWSLDKAGAWILLTGLARYLFVGAGEVWTWLRRPLPPSRRRQAFCVLIILALTLALTPPVQPPLSVVFAALSVALVGYSFGVDLWSLWCNRSQGPSVCDPKTSPQS